MKIFAGRLWKYFKLVFAGFLLASILHVVILRFIPPAITPLMIMRFGEQVLHGEKVEFNKKWVSLKDISYHMQLAVISSEDQKFQSHYGFDFEAIQKAWKTNGRKKGRNMKGGSTISQQVAKNVFLWPGRMWVRKAFETYFTILIEIFWSKERILEVYLNIIETGKGTYGVEAISKKCFKKSASKLNREEAALIAAIVPGPQIWSPCRPTIYIHKKKSWIINQMYNQKKISFE